MQLEGKLRPCNTENHLVATHLCQQTRNSFIPVPWEEELPEQGLQLCSLACHRHSYSSAGRRHDKLSHEKDGELRRKSSKGPGAGDLNECSSSGPLPPASGRKQGRAGKLCNPLNLAVNLN